MIPAVIAFGDFAETEFASDALCQLKVAYQRVEKNEFEVIYKSFGKFAKTPFGEEALKYIEYGLFSTNEKHRPFAVVQIGKFVSVVADRAYTLAEIALNHQDFKVSQAALGILGHFAETTYGDGFYSTIEENLFVTDAKKRYQAIRSLIHYKDEKIKPVVEKIFHTETHHPNNKLLAALRLIIDDVSGIW